MSSLTLPESFDEPDFEDDFFVLVGDGDGFSFLVSLIAAFTRLRIVV